MEKDLRDLIQNGFIVTTRNGNEYIRIDDNLTRIEGWLPIEKFNNDLTIKNDNTDYDIMSIHTPLSNRLDYCKGELVWERHSIKVGDFVRVKDDVEHVRYSSVDISNFVINIKPIFKVVVIVNDKIFHVEGGYAFNLGQFEKVDLYGNE